MADRIDSLIYGNHPIPKKQRPLQQRILIVVAIVVAVIAGAIGTYNFINYREERSMSRFLAAVRAGEYKKAYSSWDLQDAHYTMKDFMDDWGRNGYYGKALATAKISDSNSIRTAVIVYVRFEGFKTPIAFLVDKQTLKISYSGTNKYVKTQKSVS